jgi:hypothetical protein
MVGEAKKQITGFSTRDDMAKSLGQIHTVNYSTPITYGSTTPQNLINIDLPGELTSQLQRQIRWGQYFKVVGIDMTLDTVGTLGERS